MRLINRIDPGVNLEACVGLTTGLLTTGIRRVISIGRFKINLQTINYNSIASVSKHFEMSLAIIIFAFNT